MTSRIYPFSQLANTLLQCEQLKVTQMMYPDMKDDLDYSREHHDWNVISSAERYFPEISPQIILRTPHSWYKPTPTEKVAIRVYFKNLLGLEASSKLIVKYLPDKVEWWGKIHIKGNTECVQSCWAHGSVGETYQYASWARLELVVDEYKDDPGQPPRDM